MISLFSTIKSLFTIFATALNCPTRFSLTRRTFDRRAFRCRSKVSIRYRVSFGAFIPILMGQPGPQWDIPPDLPSSEPLVGTSRRQSGVGRIESLGPLRIHDIPDRTDSPDLPNVRSLDPVNTKLDRLLDGFTKLESRIDATDHWFTNMEPSHKPDHDPPSNYPEYVEGDIDQPPTTWQSHRGYKPYSHGDSQRNTHLGYPSRFPDTPLTRFPHDSGYS